MKSQRSASLSRLPAHWVKRASPLLSLAGDLPSLSSTHPISSLDSSTNLDFPAHHFSSFNTLALPSPLPLSCFSHGEIPAGLNPALQRVQAFIKPLNSAPEELCPWVGCHHVSFMLTWVGSWHFPSCLWPAQTGFCCCRPCSKSSMLANPRQVLVLIS